MNRNEFAAGLGARMMDKEAISARLIGAPVAKMMRKSFGMNPRRSVQVGRFAATAAPMIAGGFLQRSENPLVSGIGSAMTFMPMFAGMTGGRGVRSPRKPKAPKTIKTPPAHAASHQSAQNIGLHPVPGHAGFPMPKANMGTLMNKAKVNPYAVNNPRPTRAKPYPGSFD